AQAAPSGFSEGQTFIGRATVTTDASGIAAFVVTLTAPIPANSFVTSTATSSLNNTSEFSQAIRAITDTGAPTVLINQAAGQLDPTNAGPIHFTVVFSEAVEGFTASGVALSGTAG